MSKSFFYLLLPVLLISCMHSGKSKYDRNTPQQFVAASDPDALGFDTERLKRVDSLMAYYVREQVAPNILSFVARNGKVVHHKGYGYSDVENQIPVKINDIFRWASQTKAITSAVLLTLFEENKFLLDDPIEKYLPMFANPQVYVSGSVANGDMVTRPAKGSITIRHLLTHTSGYSYNSFGENLRVINYSQPITTKEAIERIARTPLVHDPGEKFTYGFNSDIAGYLAEVLSGKSLDVLMKERIFDPLGMSDACFYLPLKKHSRLVKNYTRTSNDVPFIYESETIEQIYPLATDQPYHGGGAGLCGTIEDYARFCQMILNKGEFNNHRVLSRKTVELMGTDQLFDILGDYKFGLGLEIGTDRQFIKNMSSVGILRWGGAYGTQYIIDPQEDMIILFFTNVHKWTNPDVSDRFMVSVYQSLK